MVHPDSTSGVIVFFKLTWDYNIKFKSALADSGLWYKKVHNSGTNYNFYCVVGFLVNGVGYVHACPSQDLALFLTPFPLAGTVPCLPLVKEPLCKAIYFQFKMYGCSESIFGYFRNKSNVPPIGSVHLFSDLC